MRLTRKQATQLATAFPGWLEGEGMILVKRALYRTIKLYDTQKPLYNCFEAYDHGYRRGGIVRGYICTEKGTRYPGIGLVSMNLDNLGEVAIRDE